MKIKDKILCYFTIFALFLFFPCLFHSSLIYASADTFTDRDTLIFKEPVIVGSDFYNYPFDYDLPHWDFAVSSIPSNYSLGAIVCTTHTGNNGGMRIEFIYTNATFFTGDSNYIYFTGNSVDGNNDYTIQRAVSSGYSWSVSSGTGGSAYTKTRFSRSIVNSALWTNLPICFNDGTVLNPSSSNSFSMRSISTSEKQSLFEVSYNGTSNSSYSVGFYACTAEDYSSWWGSATSDIASQSFSDLPSLGDDGSKPWYYQFKLNPIQPFKRTTRITPTNRSLFRKKSIQTLPSPRVVVGYDNVSQLLPAQALVNWQDWINNSDMGGVYSSTNIVIVARISYTHTDPLTGNTLTDYYFCSQQFDISSIISSSFTPDELNTPTQPYIAPSDTSDLDKLATYLRYLHVNDNSNVTIRYNNFVQHLDDSAPLYVLQGLNGWLPNLSGELDSLFSSLFDDLNIDFSVPSDVQINSLKSDIDLKEEAFRQKFYWVNQIQTEIHFVTSTVISSGDDPVVVAVDANYDSPSAERHVTFGHLVLFDASKINPSIVEKAKDIITVFLSLGLLWYIFRTLPSTIGNTPNE